MEWRYTGLYRKRKITGVFTADDRDALRLRLRERGIALLKAQKLKACGKATIRRRGKLGRWLSHVVVGSGTVEQAFLQLEILLKGDVPVVEAFESAAGLSTSYMASALLETSEQVRSGVSLKRAMETQMPWVGPLCLGLIGVGEANGSLSQMFAYSVELMRQRRKLRSEVIRAMTYPVVVTIMGLGVGYYVSTVAVPKIASVMGSPSKLPPITQSLLAVSAWLRLNGWLIPLVPALLTAVLALLRFIPAVGVLIDRLQLHIPLFGKVGRYVSNTVLNHTLALLIGSGVPVVESLELVSATLTNAFYRKQVGLVRDMVMTGRMLSASLERSALRKLSPLSVSLARIGENSGSLENGLRYVGEFYGEALERRLDLLGKLVEPALIVLVGGMVAYVYIAFFMGMAAMNASLR